MTVKRYLKSEQTDGRTHGDTDRRTFRLIESIGPEGRCFENATNLIEISSLSLHQVQESPGPVWLEVDLGEARLVSGIQSQGPPLPLHNAAYMRYIRCCSPSLHCSTLNPPCSACRCRSASTLACGPTAAARMAAGGALPRYNSSITHQDEFLRGRQDGRERGGDDSPLQQAAGSQVQHQPDSCHLADCPGTSGCGCPPGSAGSATTRSVSDWRCWAAPTPAWR